MLGIEFQKPEVTTVIRWLLRFILVIFLAWLVRQRAEQEEEECEETESDVADARARSNGLRSRGSTRPTTRLQPRRDTYNTSARQRKGVSSNESPDLDAIIEKVSKPKEMWQPRRSGEPLLLKKQDEADGTERERVAASASKPARDAQNGMTLHGHERPVTFIGFNAESNLLFSCGKDKIVCVWSFPAVELLGSYKGHNGAVWCCSATFDSRWLVTCGADRLVIVWEARTSRELARVELPGVVRCVEWAGAVAGVNASDVSERFVTCHNRFGAHPPALTVWRFDGKAIQELIVVPKLPSAANQVRWGRANYFIASAHDSGELIFWRADTGAEVKRLKAHDAGISKFDFNDDRELVATVSHDMSVCVWDVGKGVEWKLLYKAQTDRPLNAVALGPISRSAAVGAIEDRPREVCVIAAGGQDVRDVARSSSATEQFGTLLFRLGTSKVPGQLQGDGVTNKGHFGPVHTLAFASNGTAMASGSEDGFVRVHVFEKEAESKS